METALEVLSRAASMVQTSEILHTSSKRDHQESPPKELPTKMSKYHRMKQRRSSPPLMERQSHPIHEGHRSPSRENDMELDRKCAGTQTQFSSFPSGGGYPIQTVDYSYDSNTPYRETTPAELLSNNDLLTKQHYLSQSGSPSHSHQAPCSSASLYEMSPRLRNPQLMSPAAEAESCPLNLSLSQSQRDCYIDITPNNEQTSSRLSPGSIKDVKACHETPAARQSVITSHAPSGNMTAPLSHHKSHWKMPCPEMEQDTCLAIKPRATSEPATKDSVASDPIDEHFRRSLGMEYPRLVAPSPEPRFSPPSLSPSSPMRSASDTAASGNATSQMNVPGAVDEHFAKSLGATWTQLKAQQSDTGEPEPGSVDDHFAKALGGDTWRRIQAESERSVSRSTLSTLSPASTPQLSPQSQLIMS